MCLCVFGQINPYKYIFISVLPAQAKREQTLTKCTTCFAARCIYVQHRVVYACTSNCCSADVRDLILRIFIYIWVEHKSSISRSILNLLHAFTPAVVLYSHPSRARSAYKESTVILHIYIIHSHTTRGIPTICNHIVLDLCICTCSVHMYVACTKEYTTFFFLDFFYIRFLDEIAQNMGIFFLLWIFFSRCPVFSDICVLYMCGVYVKLFFIWIDVPFCNFSPPQTRSLGKNVYSYVLVVHGTYI